MEIASYKNEVSIQNPCPQLNRNVIDKLACPVCKKKANIDHSVVRCLNKECGRVFPIVDNIPILINDEDSIFSVKDYVTDPGNRTTSESKLKKTIEKITGIFPSVSNNLSSKKNFILLKKLLSEIPHPKILVVGGATICNNTDMIFAPDNIIVESDVYIGPRIQIIIDGHHIPFENGTFDLVIFQSVLEHVADPYKCVQEAHRVLNSKGIVFAATPFMQQVHRKAYDFTRYTYLGHRRLFRAFDEIESGVFAGTGVALGWSIRAFVNSWANNKYIRLALKTIVSLLFFWLKYVDYIIRNTNGTYNGASGFYFIGRKSKKILSDKNLIKLFKGN